jgi:hypothetical protein
MPSPLDQKALDQSLSFNSDMITVDELERGIRELEGKVFSILSGYLPIGQVCSNLGITRRVMLRRIAAGGIKAVMYKRKWYILYSDAQGMS